MTKPPANIPLKATAPLKDTADTAETGPMPLSAAVEGDWVSAHVFYQGDLTELLVNGIVPVARELTHGGMAPASVLCGTPAPGRPGHAPTASHAPASGWFFLRYWEGGTHLRLRVLPAPGRDRAVIEALITERLGQYLREQPSTELMRHAEYARLAPVLAAREQMSTYAERLFPNNSVVFLPYRREHNRYGYGASVQAAERHFVESSRLAVRLLAAGDWPGQRDTVAFCLILLTWLGGHPDPLRLASTSHGLYRWWARVADGAEVDGPGVNGTEFGVDEADFAQRYRHQRDQLVSLGRAVRGIVARLPNDAGSGVLAVWGRSILRLREALAHQVALGQFTPPGPGGGPAEVATEDSHTPVLSVLDICAHLMCNRLGISMLEESYLRYLAVRVTAVLAEDGVGA
jgi:hypothetical protein